MNGKLKVLYERRFERDFQDVHWFLSRYPDEIRLFVDDLDEDGLAAFLGSLSAEKKTYWGDFFGISDSEMALQSQQTESSST